MARCDGMGPVPGVIDVFLLVQPVRHELARVRLARPLFRVAERAVWLSYGAIENRTQRNQGEQHTSGQHRQRLLVRHRIGPASIVFHMGVSAHQVWLFRVRQAFARLWAMGALVRRQIGVMLRRAAEQRSAEADKVRWGRQRRCRDRRSGRNRKRVGRRDALSARAARIDGRRRWHCRRWKEQQGFACRLSGRVGCDGDSSTSSRKPACTSNASTPPTR